MLITGNLHPERQAIVTVKLLSGEELIARLGDYNDVELLLYKPMALLTSAKNHMEPYMMSSDIWVQEDNHASLNIRQSAVAAITPCSNAYAKLYLAQTSNNERPSS
jgi:hypothetical protein